MLENLTELYCSIDDFILSSKKSNHLNITYRKRRGVASRLSLSEVLTIVVAYHSSGFKCFKAFYFYLLEQRKSDFPNLVSYNRFLELKPMIIMPLIGYLYSRFGEATEANFVDSTKIQVCKNKRISNNKVFKNIAEIGKSTMGWFFGFKLHIVVNQNGELLNVVITRGNTDDRTPVHKLFKNFTGKVYADKGYVSKELFKTLYQKGVKLITGLKKNMKNQLQSVEEKLMLRKRSIIETINDVLKNCCDCEHSRHRSPANFCVNLIAGLVSYTHREKLPEIKLSKPMKLQA